MYFQAATMKTMDLMIAHHLQIITQELLEEEVEHLADKGLGIHKKVQRILTLHKLLARYTIPRTVILHTSHHLLRLGVTNVSTADKL